MTDKSFILFFVVQMFIGIWALIKMYFTNEQLKDRMQAIEQENKELKKQLRELSDTLILVKQNTELLLLGRIKTNSQ